MSTTKEQPDLEQQTEHPLKQQLDEDRQDSRYASLETLGEDDDDNERTRANTPLPRKSETKGGQNTKEGNSAYDPLVEFLDQDKDDPRNWGKAIRYAILFAVSFNAWIISMFASAYLFIAPDLAVIYEKTEYVATTGFVVYCLGWGPGPLILAPLSDTIGRKPVYAGSVFCWTLLNLGISRSTNLASIIVCRFFSGLLGSAPLVLGGGTNVDIWTGLDSARAVSLYSALVFLGPICGPIVGAAISQYSLPINSFTGGWRWAFYAPIIAGTLCTITFLILPETHHNTILAKRARKLRLQYPGRNFYTLVEKQGQLSITTKITTVTTGAVKMLYTEPIIIFISIWQTTVMAILYLFFDSFPIVYGRDHGFTQFQVGLSFIGVGVGMILAALYSITVNLRLWVQGVAKHGRNPELRLSTAILGAAATVIGLFWFGYTSYPSVHWIVSILGSAVYGFGAMTVLLATFNYVIDTYLFQGACAFAAIGLIRSIVTSVFPLFGTAFYQNLGPRNATLILACIALLEVSIPLIGIRYGQRTRERSQKAVCKT